MGGKGNARLVGRLRSICMALPEANERLSHGEPTWFAGKGKVFAMLDDHHHGAARLAVWLPQPFGAQEALIASDPDRFFRPPYVGVSGWVGVVLDGRCDWDAVAALVRDAYLHVATAKLRKLALEAPAQSRSVRRRRGTSSNPIER
jgi:predicted DNA-binding protein (MmcQ/YjbR family)